MPQSEAGWRTEPPVSVPIAHGAVPAATAAALPPLEPPGHARRGPTGSARARSRSSRSTSPSRTRPGWSCRAPRRPPPARLRTLVAVYDGQVALEDARAGRAGHALDAEQVLDRDRRQRARVGGRLLGDPQVGAEVVARGAPAPELEHLRRRTPRPTRSAPPGWAAVRPSRSLTSRPGWARESRRRPRRGRPASALLARQAGTRLVLAQHVLELDHVRGGLDPVEVELVHLLDVLEDLRQLAGHALELLVGQRAGGPAGRRAAPGRGRSSAAILGSSSCRSRPGPRPGARACRRRSSARPRAPRRRSAACARRRPRPAGRARCTRSPPPPPPRA